MPKLYSLIFIIPFVLLSACQQPTTYGPQISEEELAREEALQKRLVDDAATRGGDPRPWRKRKGITKQFARVADRIDKAGGKMCKEMGLPKQKRRCYYYFRMVRGNQLNASADGKNIVVYNGMMHFLKDDDEVAIILGHELAHNMMGHVSAKGTNAIAGALIGAIVDGVAASQGIGSIGGTNAGAQIGANSYSVSFEQEADYVGLYIAARAGYDIRKAPDLWRRMSVEEPTNLFRDTTHPANPKRAATLQKAIDEIYYKKKHHIALLPDFKQNNIQ